jgi:proteasome accessory factor C
VLELLSDYPNGLPLDQLAQRLDAPVAELREDLFAFYAADLVEFGLHRPPATLEFLGPDGDDVDPHEAEIIRISGDPGLDELGVQYVTAGELALLFAAARRLQDLDPEDAHLAEAVDVLAETMYGEPLGEASSSHRRWVDALDPLQEAIREHRRVRIVYSRAWRTGVSDRTIEPYRLVNTRRGWEVDAGPLDEAGAMRTFLLGNIRQAELLPETFEPPHDLAEAWMRQRATTRVRVRLPQSARWAADMYAEEIQVVADDEVSSTLDLDLLPPLEHRVGLLMVAAGRDAEVLEPAQLAFAGASLAKELLEHHRRTTDLWQG